MKATTTLIMLVSNPGTEVDARTRARLEGPLKVVDDVRAGGGTPDENIAAIGEFLRVATPLLAPPDAMLLEPLRAGHEASTSWTGSCR
jgi:hypothetical protein